MVQTLVSLALLAHGLGHALFAGNVLGFWRTEATAPTLLGDAIASSAPLTAVAATLFLTSLAGFVAVAWGYWTGAQWWPTALLGAAAVSAVLVLAAWGALNTSSAVFALLFDAAALAALLWRTGAVVGE